jgi:MFS family permease
MHQNECVSRLPLRPAASQWTQRIANPVNFCLLGVVYASWAARVPAVRDALQLDAAQLSIALFGGGAGAVLSFPLAAGLVRWLGARRASCCAGLAMMLSLACIALSPGLAWLTAAVFLFGASSSCFDVSINALGAITEKAAGRSIMSMLHAWFCAGALAGALLGSLVAGAGVAVLPHFLWLAAPLTALLLLNVRWLSRDDAGPAAAHSPVFSLPHGPLIILGIIGFCGAMAEGSIGDWSDVYLKDMLHASDGVAPLAFAGFTGMMLAARLIGDRLKDRHGARCVIACSTLLAAAGLGLAAMAPGLILTQGGFALAGAGLAAVFTFIFSAGGRHGPTALAGVATLSYSGSLLGPPLIGFIAQGWGMQMAIAFIALVCIAISLAAARASALD